jgi:hypothetical protein
MCFLPSKKIPSFYGFRKLIKGGCQAEAGHHLKRLFIESENSFYRVRKLPLFTVRENSSEADVRLKPDTGAMG